MKRKFYTTEERTINQFKAIDYKRQGYNVVRLVEKTNTSEPIVVAFGYTLLAFPEEMELKNVDEKDFKFIYWN